MQIVRYKRDISRINGEDNDHREGTSINAARERLLTEGEVFAGKVKGKKGQFDPRPGALNMFENIWTNVISK